MLKSAHTCSSKLKRGKRYPAGTTCKVSTANFPTNKGYPFSSMIFMSQRKRKLKNISPSKSDKLGCTHTLEFQKWSLSVVAVLHSDHRKNSWRIHSWRTLQLQVHQHLNHHSWDGTHQALSAKVTATVQYAQFASCSWNLCHSQNHVSAGLYILYKYTKIHWIYLLTISRSTLTLSYFLRILRIAIAFMVT